MATKEKQYVEAVGRRKTSIARVRLTPTTSTQVVVNEQPLDSYFATTELRERAMGSLNIQEGLPKLAVSVRVKGGGISSQADAVKHGVARALLKIDETLRKDLKQAGYLTRDPRMKERRKFGLKKARRAPQWSKR